jgi:hypothetical protein
MMMGRTAVFALMFLLFFNAVSAVCEDNGANQYALPGEKGELAAKVMLEKETYCVYDFGGHISGISGVIVLDQTNKRVTQAQEETLRNLLISYETVKYIEENNVTISEKLPKIYNNLVENGQKYDHVLGEIGDALRKLSYVVKVDVTVYKAVKINVPAAIREFILNNDALRSWTDILNEYRAYEDLVYKLGNKQGNPFSYDYEVNEFYKKTPVIENLLVELDAKEHTGMSSDFGSLNFAKLASKLESDSNIQMRLIEDRIATKKQLIETTKQSAQSSLNVFASLIDNATAKNIDLNESENKYVDFRVSIDGLKMLIDAEKLEDALNKTNQIDNDIRSANTNLTAKMSQSEDRFFLWRWGEKIKWFLKRNF